MIRFSLSCAEGHAFDSWFQSGDAFDRLAAAGQVRCITCGTTRVAKALMAPSVRSEAAPTLTAPPDSAEDRRTTMLAELRRRIEENADYVGLSFAAEARAIHDGDAPERAIYGEAAPDEARKLLEDGIPVAPLPFLPRSRTN
ncbi:MAG: DUF1178 family protein [Rubellimicrobium sp.]|nr:DUF1178 family protein [Rubellimicrobium sp.]